MWERASGQPIRWEHPIWTWLTCPPSLTLSDSPSAVTLSHHSLPRVAVNGPSSTLRPERSRIQKPWHHVTPVGRRGVDAERGGEGGNAGEGKACGPRIFSHARSYGGLPDSVRSEVRSRTLGRVTILPWRRCIS